MDDDSHAVFRPDFDLTQFRHAVARYVKLLIMSRWKVEPEFLTESDLRRWSLSNIESDAQSAWQLMREAALALANLNTSYLPRCGSGGVRITDRECAVGRLIPAVAFLADLSIVGGTHLNGSLLQAAESLRQKQAIDWNALVDWETLASIRDDLDLLPNAVSPTSKVASESRAESRLGARLSFPEGTQWSEIVLTFVSKDSVRIAGPGTSKRFMYSEMGFVDRRQGETPNRRWETLRFLAKERGILSWETASVSKQKNSIQSAISEIRRRLKQLTGLNEDPFEDYRACKAYRTKFTIRDTSYSDESDLSDDSAD